MTAARVATYATLGAVLVWGIKAVVIGLAGGLDRSPAEGPLFVLGLLLYVIGVLAVGLALTAGRGVGWRVAGMLGAFATAAVAFLVVDGIVAALAPPDPHWVWAEVQLWIVSVATAVGWYLLARRQPAPAVPA